MIKLFSIINSSDKLMINAENCITGTPNTSPGSLSFKDRNILDLLSVLFTLQCFRR